MTLHGQTLFLKLKGSCCCLQATKQHASRQLQFWCTLVYMPSLVASKYRVKSWLRSIILDIGRRRGNLWRLGNLCCALMIFETWLNSCSRGNGYLYIYIYTHIHVRSHIRIHILYISISIEVVNSVFEKSSDVLMWCETKAVTSNTFLARTSLLTSLHFGFSDLKMSLA